MKILIAEDEPDFRFLLQKILAGWGYDVVVTGDGNEALEALRAEDAPRLAILDWMMPGINGVEVCRKVRNEVQEPYTYIILLTAQQREEDLVTGMEAGADDYVTKPFKNSELRARLRAGRRIIELQNELIKAREILRDKSTHDSLTGLMNHGKILQVLGEELARADREGNCVAVLMADLDNFKTINDTYGHMAGDSVLLSISRRLLSVKRSYDSVGRYGGEEFLVILPDCCKDSALAFAERFRSSVSSEEVSTPDGVIPVTISIGVTVSSKGRSWDVNTLVKAADAALYKAKREGRNRVAFKAAGGGF